MSSDRGMYASNPYGAAVQDISARAAASAATVTPEKPRDSVLSRVAKRPQIPKPPVKFSMAPRYRFALPDPPTDLKMLCGNLETTAAPASIVHKLELDAKKIMLPLHPSFSLQADLVLPAQYALRTERDDVLPEDQIVLSNAEPFGGTDSSRPPGSKGAPVGGHMSSGRKSGVTSRLVPNVALNRSKQVTAFPWMRRMAYDEYASGTTTDNRRISLGIDQNKGVKAVLAKSEQAARLQRQDAVNSFKKANHLTIKHPDKSKSHLTVISTVPVFPDVNDSHSELISMQFDRVAPMENCPRFAGNRELSDQAFQSCVSVSFADNADKKFLSCYVPDEQTLEGLRDRGERFGTRERHERLREFSIRDASAVMTTGSRPTALPTALSRPKRAFILSSHGDGTKKVVSMSVVRSAFLLAPRGAILTPLGKPALDLLREQESQSTKRKRQEAVVDLITSTKKSRADKTRQTHL
jgi:hypothetical protein